MTKLCSVCGTENREEAQFCRSCGTAFPPPAPAAEDEPQLGAGITCDECNFQNKPGVRYCANCGVSLLGTVIVPRGRAAAAPPDPYAGTSPPPISYPSYRAGRALPAAAGRRRRAIRRWPRRRTPRRRAYPPAGPLGPRDLRSGRGPRRDTPARGPMTRPHRLGTRGDRFRVRRPAPNRAPLIIGVVVGAPGRRRRGGMVVHARLGHAGSASRRRIGGADGGTDAGAVGRARGIGRRPRRRASAPEVAAAPPPEPAASPVETRRPPPRRRPSRPRLRPRTSRRKRIAAEKRRERAAQGQGRSRGQGQGAGRAAATAGRRRAARRAGGGPTRRAEEAQRAARPAAAPPPVGAAAGAGARRARDLRRPRHDRRGGLPVARVRPGRARQRADLQADARKRTTVVATRQS